MERETYSENWYRVADVRPRLRAAVQVSRQHFRGQLWYVLQDRSGGKFFRISESAYVLVGLLDGRRTIGEAWDLAVERLSDEAPTQGETVTLLGQLFTSNLLTADVPPDTAELLERRGRREQRELRAQLMNVLFAKIPLFNPDPVLSRLRPVLGWTFGGVGLALWLGLIITALWTLAGRWDELAHGSQGVLSTDNLVWLYLAFAGTKAVHELGHGLACKQLGYRERAVATVPTIGMMLLVLVPVPYVDATSSYAFRSKWRRAWVGAAGMYYEFAVAAVACIVWSQTAQESLAHDLAYNVMFIASTTTVLFNANPLIRFDGYYILSDLLEIPNLNQRSRDHVLGIFRKHVFRVERIVSQAHNTFEKVFFVIFGVSAAVYRVFLMFTIALFVAGQLFFMGPVFAVVAVVTSILVPLCKATWYVLQSPELVKARSRAMVISSGIVALVGLLVGVVPLPERARADGVIELARAHPVHAGVAGFVVEAMPSGMEVEGDMTPLVVLQSDELEAHVVAKRSVRRSVAAELVSARGGDRAAVEAIRSQLDAIDSEIESLDRQRDDLRVQSPVDGRWVPSSIDMLAGRFVRRGERLGSVAVDDGYVARVIAPQSLGPRLKGAATGRVWLRPYGRPDIEVSGRIDSIAPAAIRELPSLALGQAGGGQIGLAPGDESGSLSESRLFTVQISWEGDAPFEHGQRVVARFDLGFSTLSEQGWRAMRQLFQRRLGV